MYKDSMVCDRGYNILIAMNSAAPPGPQIRIRLQALAKKYFEQERILEKQQFGCRSFYYLVSLDWLLCWKQFVGYDHANTAAPLGKMFALGHLSIGNQNIICSAAESIVMERKEQEYQTTLRPALVQNEDFVYVSKEMMDVLQSGKQYYTIIPIRRNFTANKTMELYYKEIKLVCLFNSYCKDIEMGKKKVFFQISLQHSAYSTVHQFKQSIHQGLFKVLSKHFTAKLSEDSFRIWTLPANSNDLFEEIQRGIQANMSYCYKLYLKEDLAAEDAKLQDVMKGQKLLCEVHQREWIFYNEKQLQTGKCNSCRQTSLLRVFCSCKYAVYCSTVCRQKEVHAHRARCPLKAEPQSEQVPTASTALSRRGLVGFFNSGNSCYMASAIQCLAHLAPIVTHFLNPQLNQQINHNNHLGCKGELATAFAVLLKQMYYGTERAITLTTMRSVISKNNACFNNYQQHDSSQLLSFLLDGLHQDLNRVQNKPYFQAVDQYQDQPQFNFSQRCRQLYIMRNDSIFTDLFFGQYKSVSICPQCEFRSISFDPFFSCPLPLFSSTKCKMTLTYINNFSFDTISVGYDSAALTMCTIFDEFNRITGNKGQLLCYVLTFKKYEIINKDIPIEKVITADRIYIRRLNEKQVIEKGVRVLLTHTQKLAGKQMRRNILPKQLYFFQSITEDRQLTRKQLHYLIYKNYRQLCPLETDYEKQVIMSNEPPFRLLVLPPSYYDECGNCKLRHCTGCCYPFDNEPATTPLDLELQWITNSQEIRSKMHSGTAFTAPVKETSSTMHLTLEHCIELFQEPETLTLDNSWYCCMCKQHVLARRTLSFNRLPTIFVVNLKRFKKKEYFQKNEIMVQCPVKNLDMGKIVKGAGVYDLVGVINHYGWANEGHYTAHCKDLYSEDWYDFDDSHVERIPSNQSIVKKHAYVLFYLKRE